MFPAVPLIRSNLAKLAGLTLLLCVASPAGAQTPVSYGDTINSPGLYFLAGNQTGSGSDGIVIESDDVFLFLGRFTLRGDANHFGIRTFDNDNVVIWGGRITNFAFGILMHDGHDCTVKDVRLDHNTGSGLKAFRMTDSWFLRLRCDQNGQEGVDLEACRDTRLISILAHDNGLNGILIREDLDLVGQQGVSGVKIRLSWAAYNDVDGIRVQSSNYHEIVKNQCVGNREAGIHLYTFVVPVDPGAVQPGLGPHDNLVKSNWCVFNHDGIVVDDEAHLNTLTNNTALANFGHDLVDDNAPEPCENSWFLNFFLTKDGDGEDCIF